MRTSIVLLLSVAAISSNPASADDTPDAAVVAAIEALGGKVDRVGGGAVDTVYFRGIEQIEDEDLAILKLLPGLRGLYLNQTPISDAGLKHVAGLKRLIVLGLTGTKITDAGLKELAGLQNLELLQLSDTAITDVGLKEVAKFKKLRRLLVTNTRVTEGGIGELKEVLPDVNTAEQSKPVPGPGARTRRAPIGDVVAEVLSTERKPIVGANVTVRSIHAGAGRNGVPVDSKLFAPAKSDDDGFVRIVIPDSEAFLNAEFGQEWKGRIDETIRESIGALEISIDHPDHPRWTGRVLTRHGNKLVLPDSAALVIRAHTGEERTPVRNLYPLISRWEGTEWSEADGVLTVRRVDLTSDGSSRWLRIIHVPPEGGPWFSRLYDLGRQKGQLVTLDLLVKPGVRVAGRVSENVPRPVVNGRVVAEVDCGSPLPNNWLWTTVAAIDPDGTFTLSLPEDETLQITASCKGWAHESPARSEAGGRADRNPFLSKQFQARSERVSTPLAPRSYLLNAPTLEVEIPMEKTSAAEVLVVDENGKPVENASVSFPSIVVWSKGRERNFGEGTDQFTMIQDELKSGRRAPEPARGNFENRPYSAQTNSDGIAIVSELPTGARDVSSDTVEFSYRVSHPDFLFGDGPYAQNPLGTASIRLVPGETTKMKVQLRRWRS